MVLLENVTCQGEDMEGNSQAKKRDIVCSFHIRLDVAFTVFNDYHTIDQCYAKS